jgi:hypothetical protein
MQLILLESGMEQLSLIDFSEWKMTPNSTCLKSALEFTALKEIKLTTIETNSLDGQRHLMNGFHHIAPEFKSFIRLLNRLKIRRRSSDRINRKILLTIKWISSYFQGTLSK